MTYTRLPKHLFRLLCRDAEPSTFGLQYEAYDGGIWLTLVDPPRFRQTLHALQESFTSGDRTHKALYGRLEQLVEPWRKRWS